MDLAVHLDKVVKKIKMAQSRNRRRYIWRLRWLAK